MHIYGEREYNRWVFEGGTNGDLGAFASGNGLGGGILSWFCGYKLSITVMSSPGTA